MCFNALENSGREFGVSFIICPQEGLEWRFVASIYILTLSMTKQLLAGIDIGWHDNKTVHHCLLLRDVFEDK